MFPYATLLASTVDTCLASVYGAFGRISRSSRVGLWEMTSRLSPYSALSLVRQRIHVWRQSMRLSGRISRSSHVGLWETTSYLSPYSALSLGRQWIHVGFSLRGFWKNFTRFPREGVQFLVRFLSCPLLCTTCARWSRQCRIAWRCRRCSSCAVVDIAVFMQRQVPGSPGTRFRSVHQQVRDGQKWAFCHILRHFSPSVQLDVRARVAGTPGACSQAFCHPN